MRCDQKNATDMILNCSLLLYGTLVVNWWNVNGVWGLDQRNILNVKFLILVVVLWLRRRVSGLLELLLINVFKGEDLSGEWLSNGPGNKSSLYCVCNYFFAGLLRKRNLLDIFQDKNITIKISKQIKIIFLLFFVWNLQPSACRLQ